MQRRTIRQGAGLLALALSITAAQAQTHAETYASGLSGIIGIEYQESSGSLVYSTNYSGGQPYNLERINLTTQARSQFSTLNGRQSEVYPSVTRGAWGSMANGTVFLPGGYGDNHVYSVTPDGSTVSTFATLPSTIFAYSSSRWDASGTWNHDLIVGDEANGKVYRIDSGGNVSTVFDVPGSDIEGLIVLSNNARYGPWAGKILAIQNNGSNIYAIAQNGTYTTWDLGIGGIETAQTFAFDPGVAALYVASYPGAITKVTGFETLNDFQSDDLLIGQEFGSIYQVVWNGSSFTTNNLVSNIGQIESFVAVPEPTTVVAFGLGAVALLARRRRK